MYEVYRSILSFQVAQLSTPNALRILAMAPKSKAKAAAKVKAVPKAAQKKRPCPSPLRAGESNEELPGQTGLPLLKCSGTPQNSFHCVSYRMQCVLEKNHSQEHLTKTVCDNSTQKYIHSCACR